MRVPRIYEPGPLSSHALLDLSEDGANHIGRVLRMQAGQELVLFDGRGGQYPATIQAVGKKQVQVQLGELDPVEVESPLAIHFGQVISRGDKMEFTIQKSVELGVTVITPLFSERCGVKLNGERLDKKLEQWQKIAISACEQCGRNRVPVVHGAVDLAAWVRAQGTSQAQAGGAQRLLLSLRAGTAPLHTAAAQNPPGGPVVFLSGPEGGLSAGEEDLALQHGFAPVTLGPRVLRAETAPLAALAALTLA